MRVTILMAALIGAALAKPAAADTIRFDYTGNEFTFHQSLFPADDRFTGYMVVNTDRVTGGSILNANFGSGALDEFSFTDGSREYNRGNVGTANMGIFTDGSGDIVKWSIRVGESVFRFTMANNTDVYPFGDESFISVGYGLIARSDVPGTWTRQGADNDGPVAPVPEPSALILVAAGLGVFALSRRRRSRRESV